ncbi:hypothetical protein [Metabacillus malikii]|uniref:Uncharacterized protein n=1 Tax=Metabacillus malikii TaxID=1504265 RepID=A0ABT9ZEJ0_9BACI|nr:hypothetical protein [Metabacillus malikii]MDQ0230256.1 hypothetical protein [Metabacillus malikii]
MNTAMKHPDQTNNLKSSGNSVICKKCKSNQVVANKRGYSFGLMFKVLFSLVAIGIIFSIIRSLVFNVLDFNSTLYGILMAPTAIGIFFSLPIALLCGFIGRNSLVNGCMNCGNKWIAGKK